MARLLHGISQLLVEKQRVVEGPILSLPRNEERKCHMSKRQSTDSQSGRTFLGSCWTLQVLALVLSFAVLVLNPARVRADDDLLDILLANGTITQKQYDTLKQHYAAQQQPQAARPNEREAQATGAKVVTAMDNAVGFHSGPFDVTISGEINGFYVHDRPDNTPGNANVGSGNTCVLCLASNNAQPNSSIRNGLLPGDLSFKIATKQGGYDLAVFFGIWPGIQSLMTGGLAGTTFGGVNLAPGNPTGFGVAGIDFRQQYVTIGKANMGTFKVGRDLGFFGQEAILNDFTLLGAGSTNGNAGLGSVTLGRIGLGYIYTDFMPQISWTSPSAGGFQVAGGIFAPLSDVVSTTLGLPEFSAPLTGHGQPQLQGKLTYTFPTKGMVKVKFWNNYITQSLEASASDLANDSNLLKSAGWVPGHSVRAWGVDYGTKISVGAADFVVYGYDGSGIGTEGLMFLSTSPAGQTRNSQGYYAQGTYTFAKKFTIGASYGQSNLSLASGELANPNFGADSALVTRNNGSYIGQARYGLTKWMNLVGEYTHTRSESQAFKTATEDSIALGTIAFF